MTDILDVPAATEPSATPLRIGDRWAEWTFLAVGSGERDLLVGYVRSQLVLQTVGLDENVVVFFFQQA